ncbi:MAG: group II intron reverse transcriptase/maturase [Cetobacterium sp.]|uniref:group II intron reverse transcriptase/maturase n=2 Tax=Cetobacterium sp. TaxID=2071632 RepID=UPI003F3E64EA
MNLIEKIVDESNIREAIYSLKSNKGSKTPGVNGETIKDILNNEDEIVKRIKHELKGKYIPRKVKRVEIPKRDGGVRPLGIPEIYDRVVQMCIKQILEPIFEKEFYQNSFGFRVSRSTEHAIATCYHMVNISKLHFVVDIDIKGFFDNINHKKLIKQLQRFKLIDNKILSIIKCMLKVETVLPNKEVILSEKGTPQGGILSPLLSNIVLNELDWWIHSQWSGVKTKKEYSNASNKYKVLKETNLTEVKIVRYADDFKLFCRDRASAEKMFKLVKIFLKDRLKLDISEKKSKIVNLRKEYSYFLGIKFKAIKNRKKYTVRSYVSEVAIKEIQKMVKEQIKEIQKRPTAQEVLLFNSKIHGVQNYYRMATMVNIDFSKIGYIINKSLTNRLGKPSKEKDKKYKLRYKGYNYQVWNVARVTISTLQACKFKIPRLFSAKNKIAIEEKVGIEKIIDDDAQRAKLRYLRNSTCEITGEYIGGRDDFYVHWIIPKEHGGTDDIENLMILHSSFKRILTMENKEDYYKDNENYQKLLETLSKYK